jgi:hypothetical protein
MEIALDGDDPNQRERNYDKLEHSPRYWYNMLKFLYFFNAPKAFCFIVVLFIFLWRYISAYAVKCV